jgi:hypothetical protein
LLAMLLDWLPPTTDPRAPMLTVPGTTPAKRIDKIIQSRQATRLSGWLRWFGLLRASLR